MNENNNIGLTKKFFRFLHNILQKHLNELFGSITELGD